jgi:putative membrane protein
VKNIIFLFLKGFTMGAANIIPGVSGGTIALITGIYERLIAALHNIDHNAFKLFFKFKFKKLFKKIDGGFLFVLLLGVVVSTFTLAKLIKYLLEYHESLLLAFFFGLILSSIIVVMKMVKKWIPFTLLWFIFGAAAAYLITSSKSISTPDTPIYIFISGFIAIIAMILPGISGSYILLILGKYKFAIDLVSSLTSYFKNAFGSIINGDFSKVVSLFPASEFGLAIILTVGCVMGLVVFSKVLNWLFKKYHDATITVLAGFMFGSLNIIWPWKKITDTYIDPRGVEKKISENIFPSDIDLMFLYIICFIVIGFIVVYTIEKFSSSSSLKSKS